MERIVRRLGFRTDPFIFLGSAGLTLVFVLALVIAPGPIGSAFADGRAWIVRHLGWFFILGVNVWLGFLIWAASSRHGHIRLGGRDSRPEYSDLSWFTMLFAGGIGTVLMFWGVAEPISHFSRPPLSGVAPFSQEAARDAMAVSIYHLGLHTWTIFTLPGLAFAYFIHRYDLPVRVSSVFYPLLREGIHGPVGKAIDIAAVLGTLFGVAVSLGLGSSQIAAGLSALFGIDDSVPLTVDPGRSDGRGRDLDRGRARQGREVTLEPEYRSGDRPDALRAHGWIDAVPASGHRGDDRDLSVEPAPAGLLERHAGQ